MKTIRFTTRLRFAVLAGVITLLWSAASFGVQAGVLDGKTFVGETGKMGKTKGDKDEITFNNGTIHSKGCDCYGFDPAPYTTTQDGDTIHFESVTTSPSNGKIEWKGTVRGDTLEGTFVWHRPHRWYRLSNAPKEYWIKAEVKK